jgi:uncharacterized membrane protein
MRDERRSHRAAMAVILIGVGMGGFVDGIVLHQIVQWHNMLSNVVPPHTMDHMRVNMTWDGLFHALTWVVTIEGVIDHQILRIHNVREVPHATVYNLTFLAVGGVLFILFGWLLMRAGSRAGAKARG